MATNFRHHQQSKGELMFFIDIEGDLYNVNAILSIKHWGYKGCRSIITFIDGSQKIVAENLQSVMTKISKAKEK